MVSQELVATHQDELTHNLGEPTSDGFKVLRMVRSDRGVSRGKVKVAKVIKAKKAKIAKAKLGKVGRPALYNGLQRAIMRGVLKVHGLTRGRKILAKEKGIKVSMTVLRSVAKEFGVKMERGRPKAA